MLFPYLADQIILCASRHPIHAASKERRLATYRVRKAKHKVEMWIDRPTAQSRDDVQLFVLKFPGTAGRAERASLHPAECFPEMHTEVWSVNPPGYGGSTGRATLGRFAAAGEAALRALKREADGRPILVFGNSLGTTTALHLAANHSIDGLLLRNPPPLGQLIVRKYGWWNLWVPALIMAMRLPRKLDSLRNAARCTTPAVIVTSENDEMVPPTLQKLVADRYAGPKQTFLLNGARHDSAIPVPQIAAYERTLQWLADQIFGLPSDDEFQPVATTSSVSVE